MLIDDATRNLKILIILLNGALEVGGRFLRMEQSDIHVVLLDT